MKFSTEKYVSPMALFARGLNGSLPGNQSRPNGIGLVAQIVRQTFALALIVLIVPMGQGALFAQNAPPPPQQSAPPPPPAQSAPPFSEQAGPPPDQGAPQGQPLSPDELGQMVAPIALYPDALVAQILAASTYPTQVVEADRWIQSQGNASTDQLAAGANSQNWDPSVKALIAFPSVLSQMDKNIQWTTDLGNAYYNQPDDVMSAVQTMRSRAQAAGTLRNTPQQDVSDDDGDIVIAPTNPDVVYVPVYNPWGVYGAPIGIFPGYYYGPPVGVYFGAGLAIGFGVGIGIGAFSHWGWGYHNWGFNWRNRAVVYNRSNYFTHSRTVVNRGFNRPGSPRGYAGSRGAYNRGAQQQNRGAYNRGAQQQNRGAYNRGAQQQNRGAYNRGAQQQNRGAYNRGAQQQNRGAQQQNRGAHPQNSSHGGAQPRASHSTNHGSAGHPRSGGGEHPH